ncbi:PAS domain-containing sensor histidine kinase [Flavobacterium sp. UMI-01]|uniref:PAS domain-containing sensor histidine kinase n=1 Tax=Flavobacterium sp. UMI-01 TaxID=1441053 RepID=UPI001C7D5146|nr:PAS domain-containing sensor histidine kinase [Flavobacterium sp. UMI-01]GIZ07964.1 hypothetical protein FUMI01_06910 [Flavobacterium sp. UMI-01]
MELNNTYYCKEFFNKSNDLFVVCDNQLNLVEVNDAALDTFKVDKSFIYGKKINDLFPNFSFGSNYFDMLLNVISTGESIVIEDYIVHPRIGALDLTIKAFKMENGVGLVVTNESEKVILKDELQTFSYKRSHDLRHPVLNILGLLNVYLQSEEVEKENLIELLHLEAQKLDKILLNLIFINSIRFAQLQYEKIDIDKLVHETVKSLSHLPNFRQIEFLVENKSKVDFYSDKMILSSILLNVIDNAIRFQKSTFEEKRVRITISSSSKNTRILIEDNGTGIPEKHLKNLFRIFFKANCTNTGSGLGLFSVRKCVTKLKGLIRVKSTLHQGTMVSLVIPNKKQMNKVGVVQKRIAV